MSESLCGICNHDIPVEHAQLIRPEKDGTYTFYHMLCEGKVNGVEPCVDCGKHRLFCNECKD